MNISVLYIITFLNLTQKRSANIQRLIDSSGLDLLSTDQISLKPHKSKGSLKGVKSTAGTTTSENETEVSKLSCEDFMEWLMRKGYSVQDCEAFRGTYCNTCAGTRGKNSRKT